MARSRFTGLAKFPGWGWDKFVLYTGDDDDPEGEEDFAADGDDVF